MTISCFCTTLIFGQSYILNFAFFLMLFSFLVYNVGIYVCGLKKKLKVTLAIDSYRVSNNSVE